MKKKKIILHQQLENLSNIQIYNKRSLFLKKSFKIKKKKQVYPYFLKNIYKIKFWRSFENFSWQNTKPFLLHQNLNFINVKKNNSISILQLFKKLGFSRIFLTTFKKYKYNVNGINDNFEFFFTISNNYRNFFLQLSYNSRIFSIFSKKKKFFNFFIENFLILNKYKKFLPINTIIPKIFLTLEMTIEKFFMILTGFLFEAQNITFDKFDQNKTENIQIFQSGGLLANKYNDKRFFKKKNSPTFIYLYSNSFLNFIKNKLSKKALLGNFNELFFNLLFKNYNPMYNRPFKNVIKNFERRFQNNQKNRRIKSIYLFLKENTSSFLTFNIRNQLILKTQNLENKQLLETHLVLILQNLKLKNKIFSTIFLNKFQIFEKKNRYNLNKKIKKLNILLQSQNFYKKLNVILIKKLTEHISKEKEFLIRYNLYDIMAFPHNGTKVKTISRK